MRYLYGDSTPFPLTENFLETLLDLTDAAVALIGVDQAVRSALNQTETVKQDAQRDQRWLEELQTSITSSLRDHGTRAATPLLASISTELQRAMQSVVDQSRRRLVDLRDNTLRELESAAMVKTSTIHQILEVFLLHNSLPDTEWGLSWKLHWHRKPLRIEASALAVAQCGLEASFALDIPPTTPWSKLVRVGDLKPDLRIHLPKRSGRSQRQLDTKQVKLARYYCTTVDLSPKRQALRLQPRLHDPARGLEIVRNVDTHEISLQQDGKTGMEMQRHYLGGADANDVRELFDTVALSLLPYVHKRQTLLEARFRETPIGALRSPAELAKVMIEVAAPYARELAKRSPSRAELSLKREVDNRRREEIFVPISEITDKIKVLPEFQRSCFDPFGFTRWPDGDYPEEEDTVPQGEALAG